MITEKERQYENGKQQYYQIIILSDMASNIAEFGESQGIEKMTERLDLTCGAVPFGDYETVIDQGVPKQFLELYMHIAEHRFAFAVTELLKLNSLYITPLKNFCIERGKLIKPEGIQTVEQAFYVINSCVLDGMIDGNAKKIISVEEEKLVWEKVTDTHEEYWSKAGGDLQIYYELQKYLIQGLLDGTDIEFSNENNQIFTLRKLNQGK